MRTAIAGLVLLLSGLCASNAFARPMDLLDRTPRWVTIAVEVSPRHAPDSLDTIYTSPLPAWFEPSEAPDRVRVVVPGWVVERHVLRDEQPKPGSFSPFVWEFDASTGHVLSAELSGTLVRRIRLGILRTDVEAGVRVAMSTRERAGYQPGGRILGQHYSKLCDDAEHGDCRVVAPRAYDPETGYVNAVGALHVRSAMVGIHSFSPLGEAVFSERGPVRHDVASEAISLPASVNVSAPPPR